MRVIQSLKNNKVSIFCSYLLVLIYFGIDRTIEYAPDTYAAFLMDDNWKVKVYDNGRALQGAIYYLIELLHLPSGIKYQLSYLSACLFLGLSIFIFSAIINKYFKNEILSVIVSFITIVNPFFIQYFLFIEKGIFCFVIFLDVCAAYMTDMLFERKEKLNKSIIWHALILISLLSGVLMYQTLITLYVILCIALIALNEKDFVKKNIYVAVMYVIPMLVAYLLAKFVFPVERLSQRDSLSEAFSAFLSAIVSVSKDDFSYLSGGSFLTWLILLAVVVILFLIYESKNFVKHFLFILYEVVGCIVISFAVILLNDSEVSPRVVYGYASIFGIVLIYVIAKFKENEEKGVLPGLFKVAVLIVVVAIGISEYTVFQKCFIERYRCNQADLYLCNITGEKIKEYEAKTGNTVDTICYYSDQARTWQDEGFEKTLTSIRAQATGWSRTYALNYYLGTNYVEGDPDPELEDYFKNINWDTYSDEQFKFDGNTLHICIY